MDDGAVDVTVGGLAAQLRSRDEPTIECIEAVTLPSASTEATTWAALVGDASERVDFEDLRMRIQAASASDAATPAERYRRDALAAAGSQARLDADPILSAVRDVAELQFWLCRASCGRRRTAAQMAWGLLRALGLLRHLLAKRLIPSEAAWRALLLAAGQIKATATDLTVREFARDVCKGALPRDAIMGYKNRAPDLRALVVSCSGRRGRRVTPRRTTSSRRRGCSRGRRRGPPSAVVVGCSA